MEVNVKAVWKYQVKIGKAVALLIPREAMFVHFGMLDAETYEDQFFVWVEVERGAVKESRTVEVFGTGWPIPANGRHIGTVIDGAFVWHAYELLP